MNMRALSDGAIGASSFVVTFVVVALSLVLVDTLVTRMPVEMLGIAILVLGLPAAWWVARWRIADARSERERRFHSYQNEDEGDYDDDDEYRTVRRRPVSSGTKLIGAALVMAGATLIHNEYLGGEVAVFVREHIPAGSAIAVQRVEVPLTAPFSSPFEAGAVIADGDKVHLIPVKVSGYCLFGGCTFSIRALDAVALR